MHHELLFFSWFYSQKTSRTTEEYLALSRQVRERGLFSLEEEAWLPLRSGTFSRFTEKLFQFESEGVHFSFPGSADYPLSFWSLSEPVYWFSYLGAPVWKNATGISVVGSRQPSDMSLQWMESELSQLLSLNDLYLVSGGARGVDQKAHTLALRLGRPTVVVVPSGLGKLYPAILQDWKDEIAQGGGAIVSEYGHQIQMQKFHFVERNRMIPALSLATLIVEARRRSGTLITARNCLEQGKPLLIVPGHPFDQNTLGGLDLLFDGATPVRDGGDLSAIMKAEMPFSCLEGKRSLELGVIS